MQVSPDNIVYWHYGGFLLNATILSTWMVIILITAGSWLITRRLSTGVKISRWQNFLEIIVSAIQQQLREVTQRDPRKFMSFVGTLFIFVGVSNVLSPVPGFHSPTGSLSTTAALAITVFLAVPIYAVSEVGLLSYLRNYLQPTFFMLPFNIIGEFTRTLALAVRLFGNVMSGTMIGAILLMIAPIFFPVLMHLLGLLTGIVQAYIFAILAAVYIGAGMQVQKKR
ncbi:F0F1 ATP synthase subunit A [Thermodesulfobacteriota bacterium]